MTHRVVVVEDEPDIRHLVDLTLGFDERIEVCGLAATGEEALRAVAAEHPDLIILDHWLQGPITGLEVARQIRGTDPATLIILFTASADVTDDHHLVDAVVLKEEIYRLGDIASEMLDSAAAS